MRRVLIVGVLGAIALMPTFVCARSVDVISATEIIAVTAVERFAKEVATFTAVVDAARAIAPLPEPGVELGLTMYTEKAAARQKSYMAAGEQLVTPRDNPAIGERMRL